MRAGRVTYTRSQPEVVLHMTLPEAQALLAALHAVTAPEAQLPVLAQQLERVLATPDSKCRS